MVSMLADFNVETIHTCSVCLNQRHQIAQVMGECSLTGAVKDTELNPQQLKKK